MCATFKTQHLTPKEVQQRAGGRRRYNAARQAQARARRAAILELIGTPVVLGFHGWQAQLAKRFGVSRATICRDLTALLQEWRHYYSCHTCGNCWSLSLKTQARLYRMLKRRDPTLTPTCCVQGYLAREAQLSQLQKQRRVYREKFLP